MSSNTLTCEICKNNQTFFTCHSCIQNLLYQNQQEYAKTWQVYQATYKKLQRYLNSSNGVGANNLQTLVEAKKVEFKNLQYRVELLIGQKAQLEEARKQKREMVLKKRQKLAELRKLLASSPSISSSNSNNMIGVLEQSKLFLAKSLAQVFDLKRNSQDQYTIFGQPFNLTKIAELTIPAINTTILYVAQFISILAGYFFLPLPFELILCGVESEIRPTFSHQLLEDFSNWKSFPLQLTDSNLKAFLSGLTMLILCILQLCRQRRLPFSVLELFEPLALISRLCQHTLQPELQSSQSQQKSELKEQVEEEEEEDFEWLFHRLWKHWHSSKPPEAKLRLLQKKELKNDDEQWDFVEMSLPPTPLQVTEYEKKALHKK